MPFHAKQKFVQDVAEEIGDFLTVTQTRQVTGVIDDKLTDYNITAIDPIEVDTQSIDMLRVFLDAKQTAGRSQKTINRYSYILERMIREIHVPVEEITTYDIRAYLMDLKRNGLQDSSLEGVRFVLSSFFGWLWKEALIQKNPCANIEAIKCKKKIRLPYSAVEIEKLKAVCLLQRDKALICFLLSTGARISEVCALNIEDVDFQNMECKVLGKGNKERIVYIDEVTAMELEIYLKSRSDNSPALFSGKGTDRMTAHGVRKRLTDLGKLAGVTNVHPHRFRRTLATSLIDRGMPIQEVAYILGHENMNTTLKYVFIDKRNVKNSYRKFA